MEPKHKNFAGPSQIKETVKKDLISGAICTFVPETPGSYISVYHFFYKTWVLRILITDNRDNDETTKSARDNEKKDRKKNAKRKTKEKQRQSKQDIH